MSKFLLSALVSVSFLSLSASAMESEGDSPGTSLPQKKSKKKWKRPVDYVISIVEHKKKPNGKKFQPSDLQEPTRETTKSASINQAGIGLLSRDLVTYLESYGLEKKQLSLFLECNKEFRKMIRSTQKVIFMGMFLTNESLEEHSNLRYLFLGMNYKVTHEVFPHLRKLHTLDLTFNELITQGLEHLTNLTSLRLSGNEAITDEALKPLTNLQKLDLARNKVITDASLKHLTNLKDLVLCYNEVITDEALKHLPNLTSLNMFDSKNVTGPGICHLTNLTNLTCSENLTDYWTYITVYALKNLPNLKEVYTNQYMRDVEKKLSTVNTRGVKIYYQY